MKKWILAFLFMGGILFELRSQPISFPSDINIKVSDIKPLIQDQEVIGYYACCYVDSKGGYERYKIVLMNSNFQVTQKMDYTSPVPGGVGVVRFNGSVVCIVNSGLDGSKLTYDIMNLEGKVIYSKHIENFSHSDCKYSANSYFLPVFKKGFIRTGPEDKDKGQPIEFINNEGEVVYTIKAKFVLDKKGEKRLETLDYYANTDSILILRSSLLHNHSDIYLMEPEGDWRLYNLETGKELNLLKRQHEKGYLKPMKIVARPDGLAIYGKYFELADNAEGYDSKNMLGTYRQVLNNQGQVISEKFLSWNEDWSQLKDDTGKKCITDTSSLWIHSIVEMANGRIFAIAEAYERGMNKMSNSVYIGDIVLVELSQKFDLIKASRFEKNRFKKEIGFNKNDSNYVVGKYSSGSFEYQYSSMNTSRSIFSSVYTTYDHTYGADDKEFTLAAVGCTSDGEMFNPKIVINNKHRNVGFIPTRTGYAALLELDPKEKTVSLTLYKFDM